MQKKEKMLKVRITETLKEKAEQKAKKMGIKLSEYIRWLIMKDIEKEE